VKYCKPESEQRPLAGFYFYTSNRQELLIERLAEDLRRQPLTNPLVPETIMVQNFGMRRWVSLQLAGYHGIEANTRYIFPNELLELAFRSTIPDYQAGDALDRETLGWSIMAILPDLLVRPEFGILRRYLHGSRQIKEYQLALRLAGLFDQYSMYRPEILAEWESSTKGDWQGHLWRALPPGLRERQKFKLGRKFFEGAGQGRLTDNMLPERIAIFGISSLPPLHLDVCCSLAKHIDITLFVLSPTGQYWQDVDVHPDINTARGEGRHMTEDGFWNQPICGGPKASPYQEEHPLLASMGNYLREFLQLIEQRHLLPGPAASPGFVYPRGRMLLQCLQRDILQGLNSGGHPDRALLKPDDRSLQIHSCHSPMREVEVLHDQLLDLLETIPDLKLSDIVVMTPDIETYAPFIQSVFRSAAGDRPPVPFSIADRTSSQESKIIDYFFRLLEMTESRFMLTEVFALLDSEPLRNFFQLEAAEVTMLGELLQQSGVRWGIDGEFRRRMGLPAITETTWKFGVERILMGYGLPGGEELLFHDILPFDDIEGQKAAAFGRFLLFLEQLKELVQPGAFHLAEPRSLPDWAAFLRSLIGRFFREEASWSQELGKLHSVLDELERSTDFDLQVEVEVVTEFLREKLAELGQQKGFLGFGITFCSMMPMRAIPFRVIALLGMNDQAFPRLGRPLSFDLMHGTHRPGDRSLKDEDRHLFLETILSCRQVLYISYVGQNIKTNRCLPPSILVSELLHHIEQEYQVPGRMIRDLLITVHPLQPFSPRYFQEAGGLFSYSRENLAAAAQLQKSAGQSASGLDIELSDPEPEFYEVNVERLVRFFDNPVRFLFTQRLNVSLQEQAQFIDEEAFLLGALERYGLQIELLEKCLDKGETPAVKRMYKARGILPLAVAGDVAFDELSAELEDFRAQVKRIREEEVLRPFEYDFTLQTFHFHGIIHGVRKNRLIRYRPAAVKIRDRLRIWMEQLILNFLQPDAYPHAALLIGLNRQIGRTEMFHCPRINEPEKELRRFLARYEQGLSRPLPFFTAAAGKYMEAVAAGNLPRARDKAAAEWRGSDYYPGERDRDPYIKRCFQHLDIFRHTDFEKIVQELLTRIYAEQQTVTAEDWHGGIPL
jgi:exodeoxyribonuclease V gamma subunit